MLLAGFAARCLLTAPDAAPLCFAPPRMAVVGGFGIGCGVNGCYCIEQVKLSPAKQAVEQRGRLVGQRRSSNPQAIKQRLAHILGQPCPLPIASVEITQLPNGCCVRCTLQGPTSGSHARTLYLRVGVVTHHAWRIVPLRNPLLDQVLGWISSPAKLKRMSYVSVKEWRNPAHLFLLPTLHINADGFGQCVEQLSTQLHIICCA